MIRVTFRGLFHDDQGYDEFEKTTLKGHEDRIDGRVQQMD